MTVPAPVPVPDPDSAPFWQATAAGELRIARCTVCRRWQHPPMEVCRHCAAELAFEPISGAGTVFSFIVVRQVTVPGRDAPYVVGLIELDESPEVRLTGIVRGEIERIVVGTRVQAEPVPVPGTDLVAPEFVAPEIVAGHG